MPSKKAVHPLLTENVVPPKLWEMKEVAECLQVKRSVLYRLMKYDGLPYIPIGGKRFFYPPSIAAWMLDKQQTG